MDILMWLHFVNNKYSYFEAFPNEGQGFDLSPKLFSRVIQKLVQNYFRFAFSKDFLDNFIIFAILSFFFLRVEGKREFLKIKL